MANQNQIFITGHVSRDAELRYMTDGTPVLEMTIAVNDKWKDKKTGEMRDEVTWCNVTVWGQPATWLGNTKKGDLLQVDGKLKQKKWTGKDGKENTRTFIRANNCWNHSRRGADTPASTPEPAKAAGPAGIADDTTDGIPF